MRALLVVTALLSATAAVAKPGIVIDELRPVRDPHGATLCTSSRTWCIAHRPNDARMEVIRGGAAAQVVAILPLPADEDFDTAPWPGIVTVTLANGTQIVLAGVERTERQMYSGGSAAVTHLTLHELRDGAAPRAVLEAPLHADISIRACFTPADERRRRSACKDEYSYRAALAPDPKAAADPRFVFHSLAQTYPGRRTRTEDSLEAPPLRASDLRTVVDPKCSLTRTLSRDPTTGVFKWDMPLPACDDFLSP